MSAEKLVEYRLDNVERDLVDHETRMRELEKLAVRIGAYATIGSAVGGAIVALVTQYLLK